MRRNWDQSFLGADGQDGNGWNLERASTFFKCVVRDFKHLVKTDYQLILRGEIISNFNRNALTRVVLR